MSIGIEVGSAISECPRISANDIETVRHARAESADVLLAQWDSCAAFSPRAFMEPAQNNLHPSWIASGYGVINALARGGLRGFSRM